jgi:hypothetical protein
MSQKTATRKFVPLSIAFSLFGLLLFVFFIRKAGWREIVEGLRSLGWGFTLVLLLAGLRLAVRSICWMRCFEAPHRLKFREAFRAYLIGDAMGNLMPLGIVVSEPVKALMVRERAPLVACLSAVAIENIFYSLSVALFIFTGTAALLLSFPLPHALYLISLITLAAIFVIIAVAYLVLRRQWRLASFLLNKLSQRGLLTSYLEPRRERVSHFEEGIYGFYARNRSRFLPTLALEAVFHLLGVLEVYVTLFFISSTPVTFLAALILESVNRIINVVFKFVPLRVGVDEAGTGMLTKILQLGTTVGVTLAIIRKARVLFWTGVGVALLLYRGLSLRSVVKEAEETAKTTEQQAY